MAQTSMRTPPPEVEPTPPRLGPVELLRWMWRQLTSMRTALFLLLLVAVAALPGSVWPQRSVDATRVAQYLADNPQLGSWLDRLGFFDVYSSPWFSAIYLLLLVSLVGCIVPRTRLHWRAVRSQPPRAPHRLERLPVFAERQLPAAVPQVEAAVRAQLRAERYRLRPGQQTGVVSAERGYLRETGNLLFHVCILTLILALAWGHLVGWRGDRILPVGQAFSNTVSDYDTFAPGPWVDTGALQPFTVRVDNLTARFEDRAVGAQFGAPREFTAAVTAWPEPSSDPQRRTLAVNQPLQFGGASVYLLGNGYAPTITVRDSSGRIVYSQATPFLPQDDRYRSTGAVKVPAAAPRQLGFTGLFLPTAYESTGGPASAFPDLRRPALVLTAYEGQLYPGGRPQSVYTLDTSGMRQLVDDDQRPLRLWLEPGQTVRLPQGRGTVTFDAVDRWAGLSTRYDPARPLALASALLALAGLVASLLIRRRRVFVRVSESDVEGRPGALVRVGALGRGEDPLLQDAVHRFLVRAEARLPRPDAAASVSPSPLPANDGPAEPDSTAGSRPTVGGDT